MRGAGASVRAVSDVDTAVEHATERRASLGRGVALPQITPACDAHASVHRFQSVQRLDVDSGHVGETPSQALKRKRRVDAFPDADDGSLIGEIVGIHLPTLLLGDRATVFRIIERSHNHRRMVWSSHKLVTRPIVFGEAGILSVRALRRFRVMQTVSPRQREPPQVRNHPIQLTFVATLQLFFKSSERHTASCTARPTV